MRVNVDDVAFMDPRFKKLGARLGMPWQEALGRCLPVWALAYCNRSAVVATVDVDAVAERSGFATAMLAVGLASLHDGGIWIHGVTERIDWLLLQDAKRQRAAEAKRARAGLPRERPTGPPKGISPENIPGNIPGDLPANIPTGVPYSLALTLAPTLAPTLTHALAPELGCPNLAGPAETISAQKSEANPIRKPGRPRKPKPSEPTPDEQAAALRVLGKLSEYNSVTYRSDKHVHTVVARLRDGIPELELRAIVAYCAVEKRWASDPKMEPYLRPSTLFGPEKVHEYRDPAVSWAEKNGLLRAHRDADDRELEPAWMAAP